MGAIVVITTVLQVLSEQADSHIALHLPRRRFRSIFLLLLLRCLAVVSLAQRASVCAVGARALKLDASRIVSTAATRRRSLVTLASDEGESQSQSLNKRARDYRQQAHPHTPSIV